MGINIMGLSLSCFSHRPTETYTEIRRLPHEECIKLATSEPPRTPLESKELKRLGQLVLESIDEEAKPSKCLKREIELSRNMLTAEDKFLFYPLRERYCEAEHKGFSLQVSDSERELIRKLSNSQEKI
ncbi:hypothetical protein [Endozoicomonas atrinae]|uniref:hypothetical protein n=1 Tax=Endozoicomonas atrinae TaxID=1333660 RepID=UPI000B2AC5B4|nr:hypothetical protein [Endozoicomonas atrinae]